MTIAVSPILILEESPKVAGVKFLPSIFKTAISLFGSAPTNLAVYSFPSLVLTLMEVAFWK